MQPNSIPDELYDLLGFPETVTTSVAIAKFTGMKHRNVLNAIECGRIPEPFKSYNMQQIKMLDTYKRLHRAYAVSADGLIFILNAMTGKAAVAWKLNLGEAVKRLQGIQTNKLHLVDGLVLDGTVYAIELAANRVKVGKAIDPDRRLATHFKSFGKATDILRTYATVRHTNYSANELKILQKFSRAGEEVFDSSFDEVVAFIESLPKTELTDDHSKIATSEANDRLMELLRFVQKVTNIPLLPD